MSDIMSDATPQAMWREDLTIFRARVGAYRTLRERVSALGILDRRFEDVVRFEDFCESLGEYDRAKHEEYMSRSNS